MSVQYLRGTLHTLAGMSILASVPKVSVLKAGYACKCDPPFMDFIKQIQSTDSLLSLIY